jgi:asparagine synthase (glutamine-hydrolysing)
VPAELLRRMVDGAGRPGPDGRDLYREQNIGFGARQAAGPVPVSNEDDTLRAAVHGTIDNRADLRRQLAAHGHVFRTEADAELLLHGYEQWSIDGLAERLRGPFAFCLWDRRRQTAYLARDPVGFRPLYYVHRNGRFAFGSELKCVVQSGLVTARLDDVALWSYLRYQFPAGERTLLAGVAELPAGHFLRWQDGQVEVRRYREFADARLPEYTSREAAAEHVRELLAQAVQEQVSGGSRAGCFLGGGLDAAVVAGLLAQHGPGSLRTYSVAFPDDPNHDESAHAAEIARALGTSHETIPVDEAAILRLLEGDFAWACDGPVADPALLPAYLLGRHAAPAVQTVFCGEGADEAFAGHARYRELLPAADAPAHLQGAVGRCAERFASVKQGIDLSRSHGRVTCLPLPFERGPHTGRAYAFRDDFLWFLLHPDHLPAFERLRRHLNGLENKVVERRAGATRLQRAQYLDASLWLARGRLPGWEKAVAANGLRARFPFLSPELLAFGLGAPDGWKIDASQGKALLRDAVRGLVPENVRGRGRHGLRVPLERWFRGGLRELAREALLGAAVRGLGVFDATALRVLADCHTRLQLPVARAVWSILLLTRWYERLREEVAAANRALREVGACRVPARAEVTAAGPPAGPWPACDIIIPIYEGAYFVRDLLRSLESHTDPAVTPFYVWLIDDGSDPNTYTRLQEMVQGRPRMTLVRNERNLGFVGTSNRGIGLGSAPVVVLLNSDTLVTPGWLERMVRCAYSDDRIAMVNPLSNRSANLSVELMPGLSHVAMAARVAEHPPTYPDVVTAVGFCLLVKRAYLDWLGRLDPVYGMGYCEESDLHMRFVSAGLRCVIADDAFVYHKGCASFGTWLERYEANRKIFDARWEEDFLLHLRCFQRRDPVEHVRRRLLEGTVLREHYNGRLYRTIHNVTAPKDWQPDFPVADYPAGKAAWDRYVKWCYAKETHHQSHPDRREIYYPTGPYVRKLPRTDGLRITFLMYGLESAGGVLSIVQLAREFVLAGHKCLLVSTCNHEQMVWPEKVNLPCQPLVYPNERQLVRHFPESDIVVATYWETAYRFLPRINDRFGCSSVYYVQDYESWFCPEDDPRRKQVVESFAQTDVRVVKSQWLADLLAANGYDSVQIHQGIDLDIFYPRQRKPAERPRVLACARPTEPRRGFANLLAIYERLYQARPDVELCFYGCPDAELERFNPTFPYTNYGRIYDLNKVAEVQSQCDVLLDPSLYQALGMPGLEAMACGVVTVLPNIGGIHEYAVDGVNTLLVTPGDAAEAVRAIMRLLDDAGPRERLIRNGFETPKRFCHRHEAQLHLELYQQLLERNRRAVPAIPLTKLSHTA